MKRLKVLFLSVFFIFMLIGCAGMNTSTPVNVATDTAFVVALQSHPEYKDQVVTGLTMVKTFLSGSVTYDDLLKEISKNLPDKYAPIAAIIAGYLDTDKPVFETYLPMLDKYKGDIIVKIDRLIFLAGMIK